MNPISNQIRVGTVGELLVILRLLQYGVQAAPPIKDSGNDLIAVKGDVFRAIQVKTTESDCFRLNNLPDLYHIVALVHLVGEDHSIYLDQSQVFLLEKKEIDCSRYRIEDLDKHEMNETLVDRLFMSSGEPCESVRASAEGAAQQIVGRERRERLSQLAWCGGGCFDSRRRVNSTVRRHPTRRLPKRSFL